MVKRIYSYFRRNLKIISMKKILLMLVAVYTSALSYAQLADGAHANDFTVTDQFGVQHNLYSYLDQGMTVILDISATWCGPCWMYHQSGTLDELYMMHGPAGAPGVDANTTNDVMVIWVDGDGATTDAEVAGGTGSQGNWLVNSTTGLPLDYPVCNPVAADADAINADYAIGYFPTVYQICPDRSVIELDPAFNGTNFDNNAAEVYAGIACSSATLASDVAFASQYNGGTVSCGSIALGTLTIKNYGIDNLTACTINIAGNALSAPININWTGDLATYQVAEVDLGTAALAQSGNLVITVTADAYPANSTMTQAVTKVTTPSTTQVRVGITFDDWPEECIWGIFDEAGNAITVVDYSVNTPADGSSVAQLVALPATGCYSFVYADQYGDGLHGSQWNPNTFGDGNMIVTTVNADNSTFSTIWNYDGSYDVAFNESAINVTNVVNTVGVNEVAMTEEVLSAYPNPTNNQTNVNFMITTASEVKMSVINMLGDVVMNNNFGTLAAGNYNEVVNFSNMPAGLYLVNLNVNGKVSTLRLTVSK